MTTPKELVEVINQCSACSLGSLEENLQSRILPTGYHRSLFVVIDSTGKFLDKNQGEFSLLKNLFTSTGIDFDTMWKTTLIKCHSGEESAFSKDCGFACIDAILKNELEFVDPKVVFLIGNDVATYFGVEDKSGVLQKSSLCSSADVVVLQDPSLVTKGKEAEDKFLQQLKPIKSDLILIRDKNSFVNFHHHNQYSMRDGYGTEEQIAERLIELRSPGFCLTNHGNINAHYRQNLESKSRGIKPIFGTEFYYNPYRADIMRLLAGDSPDDVKEREALGKGNTYHLTVVAKNYDGYRGLIWLNNQAWENFYRFPLMDFDLLKRLKGNICVFS